MFRPTYFRICPNYREPAEVSDGTRPPDWKRCGVETRCPHNDVCPVVPTTFDPRWGIKEEAAP
jgi:hypothetical protein